MYNPNNRCILVCSDVKSSKKKSLESGLNCCINRTNFRKLNVCVIFVPGKLASDWSRAFFSKVNLFFVPFPTRNFFLHPHTMDRQGDKMTIINKRYQLQQLKNTIKWYRMKLKIVPSESLNS